MLRAAVVQEARKDACKLRLVIWLCFTIRMSFWTLFAVCLLVLLVQAFVIQIAALSALRLALRVRWEALLQLKSLCLEAWDGRVEALPLEATLLLAELREFLESRPSWEKEPEVIRLQVLIKRCIEQPAFCGGMRGVPGTGPGGSRFGAVLPLRVKNACAAYNAAVRAYEERRRVRWVEPVARRMGYEGVPGFDGGIPAAESTVGSGPLSG